MHCVSRNSSAAVHHAILEETERLKNLAADLTAINATPLPAHRILEACSSAPVLDDWYVGIRPVPCLFGLSSEHPILVGEGRKIATSEVFLISEEFGCARTYTRWYRLGSCRTDRVGNC